MHLFDCFASFGLPTKPGYNVCRTADELVEKMERHGIDRALVLHEAVTTESPPLGGLIARAQCARHPQLEPVLPLAPPQTDEFPQPDQLIDWLEAQSVRALWAMPEQHRYRLDALTFGGTLEVMEAEGVPLFLHAGDPSAWDKIAELLRDFPDLTLVAVGHGCWGDDRLFRPILDRYANVCIDMSRYELDQGIAKFVERYGPDRMLFGTHYPKWNMGGPVAALLRAPLDDDTRQAIGAGNLDRLLSWPDTARPDLAPQVTTESAVQALTPVASSVMAGPDPNYPIIDTHGHFGPFTQIWLPSADGPSMVDTMDRCGVKITICSHHMALSGDAIEANRWLQSKALEAHPGRLLGYMAWNPHQAKEHAPRLEEFPSHPGFVGFKLHPSAHGVSLTDDRYAPVLEYANANKLPVLSHTWGGSDHDGVDAVGRTLIRYPDVPFLMGHSCFGKWDEAIQLARSHRNAYLELTAAYAVAPVIERFVEAVGSKRILMGTDLPWFDPMFCIGCTVFANISDDDRRNILYRNAVRLFPQVKAIVGDVW